MDGHGAPPLPEGIFSLLDTDLYKLTMQCAVLKYFPDVCRLYPGPGLRRFEIDRISLHRRNIWFHESYAADEVDPRSVQMVVGTDK